MATDIRLDGTALSLAEVGEWTAFERVRCPLLRFGIVTLTGPEEVETPLRGRLMVDSERRTKYENEFPSRVAGAVGV